MVFHWSLSDSKSPKVSRTLLSIRTVFHSAVDWMFSTRPPTSKSSSPFNNPLVTVPKAPITIGTIVTFMFHSFFNSFARSFFSHSFSFIWGQLGQQLQLVSFHWSLNISKFPQVSRTLLSILFNLNKAVVWMIVIVPLFSNSFSPFLNLWETIEVH